MIALCRRGMVLWCVVTVCAAALGMCALVSRAESEKDEAKAPNTLTAPEKEAGWKLLFDGKTTDGWKAFRGKDVPDKWQVVDGALTLLPKHGSKGGDIVTADQFDNFE